MVEQCIKKIGILGGSFNPIHNGHLYISQIAMEQLNLDKVIFIPTGNSPHKDSRFLASKEHRFNMTKLAIGNNSEFEVSDIEVSNENISYTVDTLKKLKKTFSEEVEFYFITGFDTIEQLGTWKNPKELGMVATMVAVTRPGFVNKSRFNKIKKLRDKYKIKIKTVECVGLNLSSTGIRRELNNKRSIKYLVPDKVADYIYENNIYDNLYSDKLIKSVKANLQKKLSPRRFQHSVGVAETCKKLALHYNCNERLLYLCGLLHDYSKEFSKKEKKDYCKENNIQLDDFMKDDIDLAHGLISADISEKIFNITNEDGLNSIRYHTVGRSNMSMTEKILYVADCIEPNRKYGYVEELRKLAYESIDLCLMRALELKIEYSEAKGSDIHYLSVEALDYLKNRSGKHGKD